MVREVLENLANGHQFYYARNPDYETTNYLPFRVSPEPVHISEPQAQVVRQIGQEVCGFFQATQELYEANDDVHELLDRGKPEVFKNAKDPQYLFLRPDIIITPEGFAICEIETSVFGLALAELLNRGYSEVGFDIMAEPTALGDHIRQATPNNGNIVHTDKTKAFAGQLDYLAECVFSGEGRDWQSVHADDATGHGSFYRAHYLVEYLTDPAVQDLYAASGATSSSIPTKTPQFEEKAILAFVWDKRFETYYQQALGRAGFDLLRKTIHPTWIVGEERHFAPGLPNGLVESTDLAGLTKSNRQFVLKPSGFSRDCSWAEGVVFLHDVPRNKAEKLLQEATDSSKNQLYIIQTFEKGAKRAVTYEDTDGLKEMEGKVRLTPYFATDSGDLLGIKATVCEKTNLIHASSVSVNTAVGVK